MPTAESNLKDHTFYMQVRSTPTITGIVALQMPEYFYEFDTAYQLVSDFLCRG